MLLLFGEICLFQALSDYHVTGTLVLNKLMGLAPVDGTGYGVPLQVEALVIIISCVPLQVEVLMDIGVLVFLLTSWSDFLDSIQCNSEKFRTALLYCSEQFQWVIA